MPNKLIVLILLMCFSINSQAQYSLCGSESLVAYGSGSIFDSGGDNGDYANDEYCVLTIKPPCADTIYLSFTEFDLEEGHDSLLIFDLYGNSYPLGTYTGSELPPTIIGLSGAIRLKFYSNDSISGAGFAAEWTSVGDLGNNNSIIANSSQNDGVLMTGYLIDFHALQGDGNWIIIDGVNTFTASGNSCSYTFQNAGLHEVKFAFDDDNLCDGYIILPFFIEENPDAMLIPDYLEDGTYWCGELWEGTEMNEFNYYDDYRTYINGETLIDSMIYKNVYQSGELLTYFNLNGNSYIDEYNYLRAYLQQDGEKIYRYFPDEDSVVVLYDFSLQVGDTIPPGGINPEWGGDQIFPNEDGFTIYSVSSIDSTQMMGRWYKRFWFTSTNGVDEESNYFIEGIGHPLGFLEQYRWYAEWEFYYNIRYTNADSLTFQHDYWYSNSSEWCDDPLPDPPEIWFDPGTTWRFSGGYNFYEDYVTVSLENDTLINGVEAEKFRVDRTYYTDAETLIENEFESFEYMYADSDRVYQLIGNSFEVLYDFSVQVGDTVSTFLGDYYLPFTSCEITGKSLVTEVGLDTINGFSLRYYIIETIDGSPVVLDGKIVETVANIDNYMFAQPMCDIFEEFKGQFRCYEDNYFGSYVNEWTQSCESLYLNIAEEQVKESFTLSPNPTTGKVRVDSEERFEINFIRVYSLDGVLVLNKKLSGVTRFELDLEDLEDGMYLIEMETLQKEKLVQRLIKI